MNHNSYFDLLFKEFVDTEEYKKFSKNFGIIPLASKLKIAICGSTAISIATDNPKKVPSDLDLVTNDILSATRFLLHHYLFIANISGMEI